MRDGRRVALAAAFVGWLLLGACGGGSQQTTKAEYARAANRVCRGSAAEIAARAAPDPADPDAMATAAVAIVDIQRRALAALEDLSPPSVGKARATKWLALVDRTLDQAAASARAQHGGDLTAADAANERGQLLDQRADEIARELGISACTNAAAP